MTAAKSTPPPKNVYSIPAGMPFARALAAKLLQEAGKSPEELARIRIFLPTRRACHVLRDEFLQLSNHPLILPRMQPLGDIEGEELALTLAVHHEEGGSFVDAIPPAISVLERQILLARLIEKHGNFRQGFDQALELGAALGQLLDHVIIENLSLDSLGSMVPDMFSEHWQHSLDFLKILSEHWPRILAERGVIDAADRRNRLLRGLAAAWRNNPPPGKIIAAGSTGSMPATAELLSVIAGLAEGMLVLPGLDTGMDEESWQKLDDTHPQHGLQQLLRRMNLDRTDVLPWPSSKETSAEAAVSAARRRLAGEMMRPAATTLEWQDLATSRETIDYCETAFSNLRVIDCAHEREEATVVAAMLREALEIPGRTAALVTPDRALARRVAATCRRWGIEIDDSAGRSLGDTPPGVFLRLVLQAALSGFSPVPLLALLKHELAQGGMKAADFHTGITALEHIALRGPLPPPGLAGIINLLESHQNDPSREQNESKTNHAARLLRVIEPVMQQIAAVSNPGDSSKNLYKINELIKIHVAAAESLAAPARPKDRTMWSGESGQAAASFLAGLQDYSDLFPPMTLSQYTAVLERLMAAVTVRPAWGTHPRLAILGQLEARLTGHDLIIMGGLNEGTWPQGTGHDPWMSRPMRSEFGLPSRERDTGLSAHDFVQGFCRPDVAITRSARSGGAPSIPSRWLQRLETVRMAAGLEGSAPPPMLSWVRRLDERPGQAASPVRRPEPRPPVDKRPRRLAATRIEIWQKDPYGIYARAILRLKKLDPLEKPPDAAERGQLLHKILQQFVQKCPAEIPENALDILHAIARGELAKRHENPATWNLWWPRFTAIAQWLVQHETGWRRQAHPALTERKGAFMLQGPAGPFTLEATPDRIDTSPGGPAIIDYKSGGSFSIRGMRSGRHPQLALEALIAREGGFEGLAPATASALSYWLLKGGSEPGETREITDGIEDIIETTRQGLLGLITAFDDPQTPYYSLPHPDNAPRFNDYEHLARVREWAALGETESEAA